MNTPEPVEPAATEAPAARGRFQQPALLIAAAVMLLLAVQWYDSHQQMKALQGELARRSAETVRETARDAQSRIEQIEARQHESQNQQVALEALYQELSRSRDESLFADIEQTLLLANQQIQAAGNVRAALIALQSVDARLARTDRPQLANLRKVIGRDIERLKAAPRFDPTASAARLDELAAGVDGLALLIDTRPADAPAARKPAPPEANPWLRFAREFWADVRELVRVERIDNADGAPLSASQAFFLRENLRLRLLGARIALLAHNDKSYKADLKAAADWLARYYDVRRDAVAAALAAVRQLHDASINVELPDVTPSLDALRSFRAAGERH
jgi:uroporphyrin-3 C-methyltransferase